MGVAVSMRVARMTRVVSMVMCLAMPAMIMIMIMIMIVVVVVVVVVVITAVNARILSVPIVHPPDIPSVARSYAGAAKPEKTPPPIAMPPAMLLLRPARSQGPGRTTRR
jgi:hypothetical protein